MLNYLIWAAVFFRNLNEGSVFFGLKIQPLFGDFDVVFNKIYSSKFKKNELKKYVLFSADLFFFLLKLYDFFYFFDGFYALVNSLLRRVICFFFLVFGVLIF